MLLSFSSSNCSTSVSKLHAGQRNSGRKLAAPRTLPVADIASKSLPPHTPYQNAQIIEQTLVHYSETHQRADKCNMLIIRTDLSCLPSPDLSCLPSPVPPHACVHGEFLSLLFLQAHHETAAHFTAISMPAQQHCNSFRSRRAVFYNGLQSKVGTTAAKAAALRINLNIHGCGVVAPPVHASSCAPLLFAKGVGNSGSRACADIENCSHSF